MKRIKATKLRIGSETIRNLESHGLRRAVGGMPRTTDSGDTCITSHFLAGCQSEVATDCPDCHP